MQLRKTWILRLDGEDSPIVVVRDGSDQLWVEREDGEIIGDAIVLEGGRTVSIRVGGRMHLIDITPRGVKPLRAMVNGKGGICELLDELTAAAGEIDGGSGATADLIAQMPGLVLRVSASVGQVVEAGDPLCVLEAMKMQNELGAPGAGVVSEICVEAGQSVDSGTLLIRLDPPESEEDR